MLDAQPACDRASRGSEGLMTNDSVRREQRRAQLTLLPRRALTWLVLLTCCSRSDEAPINRGCSKANFLVDSSTQLAPKYACEYLELNANVCDCTGCGPCPSAPPSSRPGRHVPPRPSAGPLATVVVLKWDLPEHAVNGLFRATVRLTVDSTGLRFTAGAQAKSKKTARSDAAERLLQKMIDGESDASDVAAM